MNNQFLGIFTVICGLLGFLIKSAAIKRRIKIYKYFNKMIDLNEEKDIKNYLNISFTLTSTILIIIGLWLFFYK
jgi:hypothetical protein